MRTTVDLPDEQVRQLADICRRDRVSRAEVVRRAVASYLDSQRLGDQDDLFGAWRVRGTDGLEYQRRLRREWS